MKQTETPNVLQAYSSPECASVELMIDASVLQNVSPGTGGGIIGGDGDDFGE